MSPQKATWLSIVVGFVFLTNLLPVSASAEKKFGVLMFSEENRYYECLKGIKEELEKAGFREPAVKYIIKNAEGSKAKTADLVRKFSAEKFDLIITLGTSATIAVSKEIKDTPVVFGMVYDPVQAKVAETWNRSGNNTTGASPRIPMSRLVNILKEFAPVKSVAVLYTPGEKNSETQLLELKETQANSQIKIIPVILNNKDEIARTLSAVIHKVDALYLSGSSIVGTSVPTIMDIASKARVITITHLDDLVEKGALLGVCSNSYMVGRLAGTKAVKVLKGEKPSSVPIESGKKLDVVLNMKTAKAGQFHIPSEFMKTVTRSIE